MKFSRISGQIFSKTILSRSFVVNLFESSHKQVQLPDFFSWIVSFLLYFVRVEIFLCSFLPKEFSYCSFESQREPRGASLQETSENENKNWYRSEDFSEKDWIKNTVSSRWLPLWQICTINFSLFFFRVTIWL